MVLVPTLDSRGYDFGTVLHGELILSLLASESMPDQTEIEASDHSN